MKKNVILLLMFFGTLYSCNLLSLSNLSNDFLWKNEKFKKTIDLNIDYNPNIVIAIKNNTYQPIFYNINDTLNADNNYRVREILINKLKKRNIISNDSSNVKLIIEKLLFEEYAESTTVYGHESGYLGESSIDNFVFEISGILVHKNDTIPVNMKHVHKSEPSESILISGLIVWDGRGAKPKKMIENTINTFSYAVYKELNNLNQVKNKEE